MCSKLYINAGRSSRASKTNIFLSTKKTADRLRRHKGRAKCMRLYWIGKRRWSKELALAVVL